jgi:hypothetical protein
MHAGIESKQSVWSQWTEATIRKVFMVFYSAPGLFGGSFFGNAKKTGRRFADQPATEALGAAPAAVWPDFRNLRASQKSPKTAISAAGAPTIQRSRVLAFPRSTSCTKRSPRVISLKLC